MKDFSIDNIELGNETAQKINEYADFVARRTFEVEMRQVTHALYEGYDGVDIHVDGRMGREIIPWNKSPPSYGPFDEALTRYDFRGVQFTELRRDRTTRSTDSLLGDEQ